MNMKRLTLKLLFGLITTISGSAYAAPTEACFQSKYDYEIYQIYGTRTPSEVDGNLDKYLVGYLTTPEYEEKYKAAKHGPAKWKKITLKHTATQANGVVTFDSTGSTTPSGEIKYGWWSEDGGFRYEKIKYPHPIGKGKPGESITLRQMVDDPVCELHAKERVTFTFQ